MAKNPHLRPIEIFDPARDLAVDESVQSSSISIDPLDGLLGGLGNEGASAGQHRSGGAPTTPGSTPEQSRSSSMELVTDFDGEVVDL